MDDRAFNIISLNIKDLQISHIQDCLSAYKTWTELAKVCQGIGANGGMIICSGSGQ